MQRLHNVKLTQSRDAAPAQSFTYTLTGKLASVSDAAGERVFAYNEYDELMTDSLTADEVTHVITENRDEYGRGIGYGYAKDNNVQQSVSYGYGTDGRLCSAGFTHGGESKQFEFSYLSGSNLLQTLTMPNGMSLTQQYEAQRDLLTGMEYKRGTSGVVERYYTYDSLGRPLTRQQNRQGGSRSDSFTHNDRSELTAGILGTKGYYYSYDNIGNRKTAKEDADEATNYDTNALNQYTAVGSFVPEFDADGNQTKVQTCTGIWDVTYNVENRPVMFNRTNTDGTTTRVTCAYDYMGRRTTKKVETISVPDAETGESTATTILHQRYIYRGYLQIAGFDLTESGHAFRWFITWDPTQRVATRPLAIRKDGTWYCYGWDLTKNVCEVFSNEGYINNTAIYSYTPYGAVTAEGSVSQPIQWSSEFYDEEMGLVYYNYRHYNTNYGRWMGRDYLSENIGLNLFAFVDNKPSTTSDILGLVKLIYASKSCRLIALFLIKFEFVESMYIPKGLYGQDYHTFYGKPWSSSQKEAYKNKVYISLRKKWNNQKSLVSVSPDCCCKTLKLQLAIDETSTSQEDFIIQVIRTDWPFFRAFQWGERVFLDTSTTGNTISHEFGHTIGLMHPNAGKIDPNTGKVFEANSPQEYESIDGKDIYGRDVSENDLMGKNPINSIMRDFYYDRDWKNPINAFLPNCKYEYKQ